MTSANPNRFGPLEKFAPRHRVLAEAATVIGLGAVGRQVAIQLTALGIPKLQLIDGAKVTTTDVTTKGFLHEDVGDARVDAVGGHCHRVEPMLDLDTIHDRFRPSFVVGTAVFCCIDSTTVRARILGEVASRTRFWGEARVSGEAVRISTALVDREAKRQIISRLDEKRRRSFRRSTRSPLYVASLAAGLLIYQFARYLRRKLPEVDVILDLPDSHYSLNGI